MFNIFYIVYVCDYSMGWVSNLFLIELGGIKWRTPSDFLQQLNLNQILIQHM